jgi:hypothetical protein
MNEHVYARVTGYDLTIVPRPPYTFERLGPSDLPIRVTHGTAGAVLATPSRGASELSGVADVEPGPPHERWTIETTAFEAVWPDGFTLHSDPSGPPGFYLLTATQAMAFAQGPYLRAQLPALQQMVGPGQTLCEVHTAGPVPWVHLTYEHERAAWIQRHHVVALGPEHCIIITLQSPQQLASSALVAAAPFIHSLAAPHQH